MLKTELVNDFYLNLYRLDPITWKSKILQYLPLLTIAVYLESQSFKFKEMSVEEDIFNSLHLLIKTNSHQIKISSSNTHMQEGMTLLVSIFNFDLWTCETINVSTINNLNFVSTIVEIIDKHQ